MATSRRSLLAGLVGAATGSTEPLESASESEDGPFSKDALADRAEALGREARDAYPAGDPRVAIGSEIAKAFREGRCRYIPQFAHLATVYDQLYWSRRFYEIFPNGGRLADLLVRLDNTDVLEPKFDLPIDDLVGRYCERAGEARMPAIVTTTTGRLPDSEPVALGRFAERLWRAVEATGRAAAARVAISHAQASARYIAPAVARWLDEHRSNGHPLTAALIPIEIGRYGALWATVEDVVGPSAIEPLAVALSAGYVPVGEVDGRFMVVTKRPEPSVVAGLNA